MKNIILILSVIFICTVFIQNSVIAQAKEKPILTSAPKGTIISNGMLKASKGYKFEISKDDNSTVLLRDNSGGISGSFECTCNNGEADGTCGTVSTPNGIRCESSDCGNCVLLVTINSATYQLVMSRKKG